MPSVLHDPLPAWGWTPERQRALDEERTRNPGLRPGRVARTEGAVATVWTEAGEGLFHLPPRLRPAEARPAVGDWVVVSQEAIHAVLPRKTCFVRRAAGRKLQRQVVAANVDVVFVVSSLDGDFSPRRLERYLTAVAGSGAEPVVLLTKAALVAAPERCVGEAQVAAPGLPVHAIDVLAGVEVEGPRAYLRPGITAALVGSSGVGKSTLLNDWLGEARQAVGEVRPRDRRGQHTTTHRELFVLPSGALVIDTPGMRELAPWTEPSAVDRVFPEISAVAGGCRFTDCEHLDEPDCAVRGALAAGQLDPSRVESYRALRREVAQPTIPRFKRR